MESIKKLLIVCTYRRMHELNVRKKNPEVPFTIYFNQDKDEVNAKTHIVGIGSMRMPSMELQE